jgi:hypothetical protein
MTTMTQLDTRITKLERAIARLKRDPDTIATIADTKAIKALHRAEKAGTLVHFDDLERDLDRR